MTNKLKLRCSLDSNLFLKIQVRRSHEGITGSVNLPDFNPVIRTIGIDSKHDSLSASTFALTGHPGGGQAIKLPVVHGTGRIPVTDPEKEAKGIGGKGIVVGVPDAIDAPGGIIVPVMKRSGPFNGPFGGNLPAFCRKLFPAGKVTRFKIP